MKNLNIFFLVSFGLFISCLKPNCESASNIDRENECILILNELPSTSQAYLSLKGRDIQTGNPCTCKDNGRWWLKFRDNMSVGDTLIKRKGELVFYIHKKDTILSFPWECEGKIYK
ncbi:hypothetical protein [Apibacter adventoris]|uniref:hypothetical protein n=1 Tax=Apibacter adventoris TaxID=1679466 RepID=UPI000CF5DA88|nr:hypothetical protein [Apibacter adventoris]PQL93351.1 hypothetical protein C4S76_08955 [Apibacter adventoris]PQL94514.1 hypothetical protein C4S76_05090 [Apibacter adventoris]